VINIFFKTENCFIALAPADKLLNAAHLISIFLSFNSLYLLGSKATYQELGGRNN